MFRISVCYGHPTDPAAFDEPTCGSRLPSRCRPRSGPLKCGLPVLMSPTSPPAQ